jgi:hypothetical protein
MRAPRRFPLPAVPILCLGWLETLPGACAQGTGPAWTNLGQGLYDPDPLAGQFDRVAEDYAAP